MLRHVTQTNLRLLSTCVTKWKVLIMDKKSIKKSAHARILLQYT